MEMSAASQLRNRNVILNTNEDSLLSIHNVVSISFIKHYLYYIIYIYIKRYAYCVYRYIYAYIIDNAGLHYICYHIILLYICMTARRTKRSSSDTGQTNAPLTAAAGAAATARCSYLQPADRQSFKTPLLAAGN